MTAENAAELSCRELVELVTEYLDDALPAAERARFERHLVWCPPCRVYLQQMRQTLRLAGRLTEGALPRPGREALLRAFRDWKSGKGET